MQVNPIILKDLKLKMRSFKTSALTMRYLGILGIIAIIAFLPQITYRSSNDTFSPQTVLSTYLILAIIQYIMIIIITPMIIADSINSEREKNTIDLLLCTDFSTLSFIFGKASVSMIQIFLLIITSLPIMATVFLFGGISISSFLTLFGFYLATSLMIASLSLLYTTIFKNLKIYRFFTYFTSVLLICGLNQILVKGFYIPKLTNNFQQPIRIYIPWPLSINPVYGFGSVLDSNSIPFLGYSIENPGDIIPPMFLGLETKPWLINLIVYLLLTIIFLLIAGWNLNPVKKTLLKKSR